MEWDWNQMPDNILAIMTLNWIIKGWYSWAVIEVMQQKFGYAIPNCKLPQQQKQEWIKHLW